MGSIQYIKFLMMLFQHLPQPEQYPCRFEVQEGPLSSCGHIEQQQAALLPLCHTLR